MEFPAAMTRPEFSKAPERFLPRRLEVGDTAGFGNLRYSYAMLQFDVRAGPLPGRSLTV